MDINVSLSAGAFHYEVSVTETGPDGIRDVQAAATAHFLACLGDNAATAVSDAAHAVPTFSRDDD